MKFLALAFLVVVNLIAVPASARDITIQPLTRLECERAAVAWDENRNVCSVNSREAESQTELEPGADVSSQPLTRLKCDEAGLTWDENVNVCQSGPGAITKSQPLTREECGKAGMPWLEDAKYAVRHWRQIRLRRQPQANR